MTDALTGQLAWLAGLIDADGHVGILLVRAGGKRRRDIYMPQLHVTNVCMRALRLCRSLTGVGRIYVCEKPKKPTHRQKLRWHASGPQAITALSMVLPHLVIKQRQAILAIEAQTYNHRGRFNEHHERLNEIRLLIQKLNHDPDRDD